MHNILDKQKNLKLFMTFFILLIVSVDKEIALYNGNGEFSNCGGGQIWGGLWVSYPEQTTPKLAPQYRPPPSWPPKSMPPKGRSPQSRPSQNRPPRVDWYGSALGKPTLGWVVYEAHAIT